MKKLKNQKRLSFKNSQIKSCTSPKLCCLPYFDGFAFLKKQITFPACKKRGTNEMKSAIKQPYS